MSTKVRPQRMKCKRTVRTLTTALAFAMVANYASSQVPAFFLDDLVEDEFAGTYVFSLEDYQYPIMGPSEDDEGMIYGDRLDEPEFVLPIGFFRATSNLCDFMTDEEFLLPVELTIENAKNLYSESGLEPVLAMNVSESFTATDENDLNGQLNSWRSSIISQYAGNMICCFIFPDCGGIFSNGNCGSTNYGSHWVQYNEGCLSPYTTDLLSHELGHALTLAHTFQGTSTGQRNNISALGPDGLIHDYLSQCYLDQGCEFDDDDLCDTPKEVNPACTQVRNLEAYWWAYDTVYDVWYPGRSAYVPNYTAPFYVNDPWWSRMEFYDMYLQNIIPPCVCATDFYDCPDGEGVQAMLEKPFETNGYYNVMSYGGGHCDVQFSLQQMEKVHDYLDSNPGFPLIQNIVSDLFIVDDGDVDADPSTFSTLGSACDFISNDYFLRYRVFVTTSYEGYETDTIWLRSNNIWDLDPAFEGRPVFVDVVGIESYEGQGADLTWVPADQGSIVVHQSGLGDNDPIYVEGRVRLSLSNLQFEDFGLSKSIPNGEGIVLDFRGSELLLSNCTFTNNGIGATNAMYPGSCGGVVNFAPSLDPALAIDNCIFAGNQAPIADAVALTMSNIGEGSGLVASFRNSTFVDNTFNTGSPEAGALHVESLSGSLIFNCIFSGSDDLHGTPGDQAPIAFYEDGQNQQGRDVSVYYSFIDQDLWAANHASDLDASVVIVSHTQSPGFVNAPTDYRLRWDSICMDQGDPTVFDFDETCSDIGWSPEYTVIEIAGTTDITEAGHYLVTGSSTTITGDDAIIPDGSVLKFSDGYNLYIKDNNSTNGYNIVVGDANGARTAIVGSDSYGSVCFGNYGTGENVADCQLNGVLFNKLTNGNVTGFMRFSNCNVDVNGLSGNVAFNECESLELYFAEICQGSFTNFDFSAEQIHNGTPGFGWVDIVNSDIDVENVVFDDILNGNSGDPISWFWKVLQSGTVPGDPQHVISGCDFPSTDNGFGVYPVYAVSADLQMHHNEFTDVEQGAIYAYGTALNMTNGAMNVFTKSDNNLYFGLPLVSGVQNPIDMYCGYNSMLSEFIDTGELFVDTACQATDWRKNFWGTDCSNSVDPSGHVPSCVTNYAPTLSSCPNVFVPCDDQLGDESPLYTLGVEADAVHNYEAACVYWTELMVEFPESKYCTSVTGSMKAIGLLTVYGMQSYSQIRSDLEAAADEAETVDFLLSVYQLCSAWCVEARHGDRPAALALLDDLLLEVKGNKDAEALINVAIAEIGLYPEQGGTSAAGPEMEVARLERQIQNLRAYQTALLPETTRTRIAEHESGSTEQSTQPGDFQLIGCYPNPFNPVTTIELDCRDDVALALEIYNLAGQRVDVLHSGMISAGRHLFKWDAANMASGIYFVRAEQGKDAVTSKLMLMR